MFQTSRRYKDVELNEDIELTFQSTFGEKTIRVTAIVDGKTVLVLSLDRQKNKDLRHVLQQCGTALIKQNVVAPPELVEISKGLPPTPEVTNPRSPEAPVPIQEPTKIKPPPEVAKIAPTPASEATKPTLKSPKKSPEVKKDPPPLKEDPNLGVAVDEEAQDGDIPYSKDDDWDAVSVGDDDGD